MSTEVENERREGVTLTQEQEDRIIERALDRLYLQVGKSVVRATVYLLGAAITYLAYVLVSKGWINPEAFKEAIGK